MSYTMTFPPVTWGGNSPAGNWRPRTGGTTQQPPVGGSPLPPAGGNYPSDPLPPVTPPPRPPNTPAAYLPGVDTGLGSNMPGVDYGDITNRIGAPPALGAAPTMDDEARRRLARWLDSGGASVAPTDSSTDPLVRARMAEARGRASATANRAASDYAAQTGHGSGSAAYATRRGVLSLLGEGAGQRDANTLLDTENKYRTGINEANANRYLQGATSSGGLENAANANALDAWKTGGQLGLDAWKANLSGLGFEADLAHKGVEDWLAASANARGNQGTADAHTTTEANAYNQTYQQWLAAQDLELRRQEAADARARAAAVGPYGTGEIIINPDGTTTTRLPIGGGGGSVGGGGTYVGGGAGGNVSGGGVITGGSGGGALINRPRSPAAPANIMPRIQALSEQIANIQGRVAQGIDPSGRMTDQANNLRVKLGVLQALAQSSATGPTYDPIRERILALADGDLGNYSPNRTQIINLLATLGTSLNGRIPTYFGMAGGDTEQGVRQGQPQRQPDEQQAPPQQQQQPRHGPVQGWMPAAQQRPSPSSQWQWN